jgi:hypothetical protein
MCVLKLTSKTSSPAFDLFPNVAAIPLVGVVGTAGNYVFFHLLTLIRSQSNCFTHTRWRFVTYYKHHYYLQTIPYTSRNYIKVTQQKV